MRGNESRDQGRYGRWWYHFAGWADINVPFSVVPKIFQRKRPILALRFVDYWDMRRNILLIDDPVERVRRAIGRISGKKGRLEKGGHGRTGIRF